MSRRRLIALLLAAALPAAAAARQAQGAIDTADRTLAGLTGRYIDGLAQLSPETATTLGIHKYDDRLRDYSPAGRAAEAVAERGWLRELDKIDPARLTRADQVDAAMLRNALKYQLWTGATLQSWAWDPQTYNDAAGASLYGLAARDFAPWPVRLRSATARMEKLPGLFAQARANLVPARVPRIHAETVAKQNAGILDIVDTMLVPHAGELAAADRARFDAAVAGLRAAVATHQTWLDTVLVPNAAGDFRIGPALYDAKLAFALNSPLSRAEIKRRATAAMIDTRAEMYQLARDVLKDRPGAPPAPAAPTASEQQAVIEAALKLAYAKRPARDGVIAEATAALGEATAFVRAKNLVTVPDSPIGIITMPVFQQGVAVAYCDSPGPLEKQLGTFVAVSPIPAAWTQAQADSFLSEYNDYMVRDLMVHEAMPGHYLQLAHQNAYPSTLRAVLGSGAFVEGWAVYMEGQMADAGFMNADPLYKLTVLKMRLRSISNALLDIGIHTEGMTEAAAMKLMMTGAFQQEREAAGKWTRARLGSTQLPSYFVGYSEHRDLRAAVEKRDGAAFDVKKYHDTAISFGSPPVRYVRALMLDEPVTP
ncbi:MAG: DUF885 domain-containing protein [Janthinobacterium lividum]